MPPKRSSKPDPVVKTVTATAAPAVTYTWVDIIARAGAPTREDDTLYTPALDHAGLVRLGARIGTGKILTDMLRWLGQTLDYRDRLPASEREAKLGAVLPLVRIAAREGGRLRQMNDQSGDSTIMRSMEVVQLRSDAERKFEEGHRERDRLRRYLVTGARYDRALSAEAITAAYGTAADYHELAASLRSLAAFAAPIVARSGAQAGAILKRAGYAPATFERLLALATEVETAGDDATGVRKQAPVVQSDIDRQDGICLVHLEALHDLMEAVRELDVTAPHLVPIATRPYFGWRRGRSSAPDPEPAPAPVPGGEAPPARTK